MSNPKNPLTEFDNVAIRHIMVAFKNTQDASKTIINDGAPGLGDTIPSDCGAGMVVLNEFHDTPVYFIKNAEWEFDYYSPIDREASRNAGFIEVVGRVGTDYMDFIRNDVTDFFGVHVSHLGFALRTFFICSNNSGDKSVEIKAGNAYVFHVPAMVIAADSTATRSPTTLLMTVSPSHTMAQLPNYSNVYQMTLTHESGNLHKTIPEPRVKPHGLIPRAVEDGLKINPRNERLDKSPPMKNLGEVFKSLEKDLDEQKFAHKAQLQEWLRYIRDDHVDKIVVPPKQLKDGVVGDALPIVFHVELHDGYGAYPVDNINLPFEQPEQSATHDGIRSITVEPSTSLVQTVHSLMRLSSKVGEDAVLGQPKMPKVSVCLLHECDDKYHVYIHVTKEKVPWNSEGKNSGPDKSKKPLTLYGNRSELDKAPDIISISAKITYSANSTPLEIHNGKNPPASVVYGDREQITLERERDRNYFKTMFSGVRPMHGSFKSDGLEMGDKAEMYETLNNAQYSTFTALIHGNNDLLSDVNRLPHFVADNTTSKKPHKEAQLYDKIESWPMYARLLIGEDSYYDGQIIEGTHHSFDKYYHLSSVKNIFGGRFTDIDDRHFVQEITLRRTDNTM